jgi:hypothetical protein
VAEPSSYNGPAEVWSEGEIRFPEVQVRLDSGTEAPWVGQIISGIPLKDISDMTEREAVELKLPNNETRQIVFPEPDDLRFDGRGTPPWV